MKTAPGELVRLTFLEPGPLGAGSPPATRTAAAEEFPVYGAAPALLEALNALLGALTLQDGRYSMPAGVAQCDLVTRCRLAVVKASL